MNEKEILVKCSEKLETILELAEILLDFFLQEGFTPDEFKFLSELSILLGLLRNVSTLSLENRAIISHSKILRHFSYFVYIKLGTEENMGVFSKSSYEIIKMLDRPLPEETCYNNAHIKECMLLTCRFLQLLANISVDCNVEYSVSYSNGLVRASLILLQDYLFKTMYPFGFINIYLVELIALVFGRSQGIKTDTSAVACSFHLLYNLTKSRPCTMDEITGKRELFECFIFVSVSMYLNELRYAGTENLKSSEWIFFFFKDVLSRNPTVFCDLYFYKHSEESKADCDASLIYLTMQEPFVKLSMFENNTAHISEAKITREIFTLQKHISDSLITEHEFKDILLEICADIDTNPNLKQDVQESSEKNIASQILALDDVSEAVLSELERGASYLNQFVNTQIESCSGVMNKNQEDFSSSRLGNIKGWISIFRINMSKDERNFEFFNTVLTNLASILKTMLKFKRYLADPVKNKDEETKHTWKRISEEISMASVIQAISTICYGNTQLQNSFCRVQDSKFLTNITLFEYF